MNMTQRATWLTSLFVLVFAATQAQAQITVVDSAIGENNGWAPSSIAESSFGTFSLSGADKLVVTLAGRDTGGFSGVTYNGQALTQAVSLQASGFLTSIWYLDSPGTTTGDLQFSGGVRGVIAGLYALSGTDPGVGNVGSASTNSATLTTTSANSWVLASAGFTDSAASVADTTAPVPAAGSPMTEGENLVQDYANYDQPNALGDGYQTVATAESATSAFDSGDVTTAAEFLLRPPAGTVIMIK